MATTQPYPLFVINLDRSPERLTAMASKLRALGLEFTRIPATDGKKLSEQERAEFAHSRPLGTWSPGSIGCFMSHHRTWKMIAEGTAEFGIVFEDDMNLSPDLPDFLGLCAAAIGQDDLIRLEATRHRLLLDRPNRIALGPFQLAQVRSESWGAGGYILSRKTARALMAAPQADETPADYHLFSLRFSKIARGVRILQVVPALCVQGKYDLGTNAAASTIEHGSERTVLVNRLRGLRLKLNGLANILRGYRRVPLAENLLR